MHYEENVLQAKNTDLLGLSLIGFSTSIRMCFRSIGLAFLTAVLATSCNFCVAQDFDVFRNGKDIQVVDRHTRHAELSSTSAAEAMQYALDQAAKTGGNVSIGSGRFFLEVPLKMHDHTSLRGSGRSTKLVVSEKNAEGVGIKCQNLRGVEISDLCLSSGSNDKARIGLLIDHCGDMKIFKLFIVGFQEYGMWLRKNSFLCETTSCTFAGNRKTNLFLDDLFEGRHGNYIPNLVSSCTIYGGGKGIECHKVVVLNIVGCNIYQTGDIGIHLRKQSNSVLIIGCRTFQISADAVVVENSHELNVTGNIFCWCTGDGIVVRDAAWGSITGNNIIDNGSHNPGGPNFTTKFADIPQEVPLKNGMTLSRVRGYTVANNSIFNWNLAPKMRYGIHEDDECFKNLIEGNSINYFLKADVLSEGQETLVRNNVVLSDVTHAEIGRLTDSRRIQGPVVDGYIQTYQPELIQEFIDSLK